MNREIEGKTRMDKMKKNYSKQPNLILYTNGGLNGEYLFININAMVWLSKQPRYSQVRESAELSIEIVLLPPVGSNLFLARPLQPLKQILKSLLRKLPEKWKKRLPARLQIKRIKRINSQSLYHQVYSGKTVCFTYEKISFSIKLFRERVLRHGLLWLRSKVRAFVLWRECFKEKTFIPSYFLGLSYQGVHIGDLAAAHTLRTHPKLGGSLQACKGLFNKLADAIYICDLSKTLCFDNKVENYVMVFELCYLYAIYQRNFHALGAHIITTELYKKEFLVIPAGQEFSNPGFVLPPLCEVVDTQKVISYMDDRLLNPTKCLRYMYRGANNNTSEMINDMYGKTVDISKTGLTVIVFLHSFSDAQYIFGLDGFDNLYHWTIFTIDTCLMNKSIDRVLIKPHPNVDIRFFYPGDKVALDRIFNKYKGNPRVIFLDKFCPLVALSKGGKLYGITHHGSVAEEMVYLKQPVIASVYAPWGVHYPFVKTWQTVEEYKNILESISSHGWAAPSELERAWLFRYVHEYRFKQIHFDDRKTRLNCVKKFAGLLTGEKIEITRGSENYYRYRDRMENLAPNTQLFNDFLNVLLHD